jgi:hypothetical protein
VTLRIARLKGPGPTGESRVDRMQSNSSKDADDPGCCPDHHAFETWVTGEGLKLVWRQSAFGSQQRGC